MNKITFIILRHVSNSLENSDELWKECYKSIRRFYNNEIIILDNNSDYSIIKNNIILENCKIINVEYFNNRLFSPFYYLLNVDFERAVIFHDGCIIKKFVDFSNFMNVKFIWHFDTKMYDNIPLIEFQLNKLTNNSIPHDILIKNEFTGCMGCCLCIEKKFLMELEDTFKLSNLRDFINCQEDAIAFERTISLLCFSLFPELKNDLSFENEMKFMVWGYSYADYINEKRFFDSIDIEEKSIIKIFGARK